MNQRQIDIFKKLAFWRGRLRIEKSTYPPKETHAQRKARLQAIEDKIKYWIDELDKTKKPDQN